MARPISETPPRTFRQRDDGRLECVLCPRRCRLRDGQRGFCFVRVREADAVVLATYGRSSGFCVDPIEKKPLHHFLPGTSVLSFGTAGCNLGCRFCQNWDISACRDNDRLVDSAPPETIADAAVSLGCRSVAFTYNDPVIFLEYAVDVAEACHARGIRTVAVTAGYIEPAPRAELFASIDAANVDLKSFDDGFYRRQCSGRLAPVLDTLTWIAGRPGIWLEITNLLIPGLNDDEAEIDAMTRWIRSELGEEVPLHFTAFHPDAKMLDRPPTPAAILRRARDVALGNGLRHVYIGNVHDPAAEATTCPGCGATVIGRSWYRITHWALDDSGRCLACGRRIAGVFDGPPGTWGARRLPVRLGPARP